MIADNTTYNRAHGNRVPLTTSCASAIQCVNFIITKSKHRKGNFISVCRRCLCFDKAHGQALGTKHSDLKVKDICRCLEIKETVFTFHWLHFDFTGREGGPQMSDLVWSDSEPSWCKPGKENIHSLLRLTFQQFCCFCLLFFPFVSSCGMKKKNL